MKTIEIAKVSVSKDGRLAVYPTAVPPLCEHIYRAAAGVDWNNDLGFIQSTSPKDWDHRKWFGQIVSVVRSELGIRLDLTPDTEFVGPQAEFRTDIVNANAEVQRWICDQELKQPKIN